MTGGSLKHMTTDQFREFQERFAALDLGPLECIREVVEMIALENVADAYDDPATAAIVSARICVEDPEFGAELLARYSKS